MNACSAFCVGTALLVASPLVRADASAPTLSANVALTSEYLFRGIAQTNGKPALQGGFDLAHASGFYAGTWGSSISWLSDGNADISASLEWDLYAGYTGSLGNAGLSYDVGALLYLYPGDYPTGMPRPNTTELYLKLNWGGWSLGYSSNVSRHLFGATTPSGSDTRGSGYTDLTYIYDFGHGWDASAHVGYQDVRGFAAASYADFLLGVGKSLPWGRLGVSVVGTTANGDVGEPYRSALDRDLGKTRVVVDFSRSL